MLYNEAYIAPIMKINPTNNNKRQQDKDKNKKSRLTVFNQDEDSVELSYDSLPIIDKIYDDRQFINKITELNKKVEQ